MKEKVGSEFFQCRKRYYSIYDTFALLDRADKREEGEQGAPPNVCLSVPDGTAIDDALDLSPAGSDVSDCEVAGTSIPSI